MKITNHDLGIIEGWCEEDFLDDESIPKEDIEEEIVELYSSLACIAYQVSELKRYVAKDSDYAKCFFHEFWNMFKK